MNKYLIIDNELTALNSPNNLITSYLGIMENDVLIDELDLKLIPDDGKFTVDPESMGVNKIDIRNWEGIKYKDARKLLGKFIRKHVYDEKGKRVGNKLLPLGQDVLSDIKTIQDCLISKESWDDCCRLIPIDTVYLATVLRDMGKLNLKSLSLENLAKHFEIEIVEMHSAKNDAILSYQVYKKLQELIYDRRTTIQW